MVDGDLAEDGKASAHTTFIGDVLKVGVLLIDIVAHLVGEFDEVKFTFVEGLVDNRIIMMDINIVFVGDENNFICFYDEFISCADVFVKSIGRKFGVFEIIGREEFHGGRDHEAIFLEHISESLFCGENLLGIIMTKAFSFAIRVYFFERTNCDVGL